LPCGAKLEVGPVERLERCCSESAAAVPLQERGQAPEQAVRALVVRQAAERERAQVRGSSLEQAQEQPKQVAQLASWDM
jgi:hypothetical protein